MKKLDQYEKKGLTVKKEKKNGDENKKRKLKG